MTAFSLAPYPSLAGRPNSQLYFGLHPQGFAVSSAFSATSAFRHHSFNAARSRFCARAGALAPHPLGCLCVQWWRDFPHRPELASGSRPSSLALSRIPVSVYNAFADSASLSSASLSSDSTSSDSTSSDSTSSASHPTSTILCTSHFRRFLNSSAKLGNPVNFS